MAAVTCCGWQPQAEPPQTSMLLHTSRIAPRSDHTRKRAFYTMSHRIGPTLVGACAIYAAPCTHRNLRSSA